MSDVPDSYQEPPTPMDLPVDKIIEAPWNVNVMSPELYDQLLRDMKASGPTGVDPISVAGATQVLGEPHKGYVTIDGAQRLRAAKELDWTTIRAFHHQEIKTEEEARLFNYRRDAERGTIDQFKLAQSFKWFSDQGFNHNIIAERFGIDRSTVTKRLSLLNLDEKVKTKLMKDEGATVSHLEPISTLTPELQRKAVDHLRDYSFGGTLTVKAVQNTVDAVKKWDDQKQRWIATVAKSKFPKCPKCKQDPVLPSNFYGVSQYLRCGQNHDWSMTTGRTANEDVLADMNRVGGRRVTSLPKGPPPLPQHVKSSHKPAEYEAAMWPFLKKLWPEVKLVDGCSIQGELKSGKSFSIDYNGYHFAYDGDGEPIEFAVEEITSKDYNKRGFFSRVKPREGMSQGVITSRSQLEKLASMTEKFIQDHGDTPRTQSVQYQIGTSTTSWNPAAVDKVKQKAPRGTGKPKK